jgi:acetoin:2,6-dichlorophenolindophenol oxidoreductase subunit alpha
MHLFSKQHLAASSGIVGAAGPVAAGFALAAQLLRPGTVAVAFFGEGAMNQGMLMESLNLAAAWRLPAVFVCKDDGWSITTRSDQVTGGDLSARAQGLGVPAVEVDGRDVSVVCEAAGRAIDGARSGRGPTFLRARCVHFDGHFLGFQLMRIVREPLKELPGIAAPLTGSFLRPGGASLRDRVQALKSVLETVLATARDPRRNLANDPLPRARAALESEGARLHELEGGIEKEVSDTLVSVLAEATA